MLHISPFKVPYYIKKGAPLKTLPHLACSECKVKWELSQLSISNQSHFAVIWLECHFLGHFLEQLQMFLRTGRVWSSLVLVMDYMRRWPSGRRCELREIRAPHRSLLVSHSSHVGTSVWSGVLRVTTVNSFVRLDKCDSLHYYRATLLTTKSTHDIISWEMHSLSK